MSNSTQTSHNSIDPLTGLANRSYGIQLAKDVVDKIGISNVGAIAVELSQFGQINNSMGIKLADKVLKLTAKRLVTLFPHALCSFRSHGDQFCLFFDRSIDLAFEVERLIDFVKRPFAVQGNVVILSTKIGVCDHSSEFEYAEQLVYSAELALHNSKQNFEPVTFYNADMIDAARLIHQIGNDLRVSTTNNASELHGGEENEQFFVVYQPIVSSITKRLVGIEALLRWRHPEKGVLMPSDFMKAAEDIGAMELLGSWIIKRSCSDLRHLIDSKTVPEGTTVSVNLSASQFSHSEVLLNKVAIALKQYNIAPKQFIVELSTSTKLSKNIATLLNQFRNIGCSVAIDDFGVGSSSILELADLSLDYVKIDRTFASQLDIGSEAQVARVTLIGKAIYDLAHQLGLIVVTKGVENTAQLKVVKELNADFIQGYIYSEPLLARDVASFVKRLNS